MVSQAQLGYSTCHWFNIRQAKPLFDREGWLARLKERAASPYPLPLRTAIIAKSHPVLRAAHSAFAHQIATAAARNDSVSANHRTAALLASYFDIVLAVNCMPHPGEKRLVRFVEERCDSKPAGFPGDVSSLIEAIPRGGAELVERVTVLLDAFDDWLGRLGMLPTWPPDPAR